MTKEWLVSEQARKVFLRTFTALVIGLCILYACRLLNVWTGSNEKYHSLEIGLTAVAGILMIGWLPLFLGMTRFWVGLDNNSYLVRVIWLVLVLCSGLFIGTAAYYLFVYRSQVRSI
jgi:uncharacterized membrane protein